MTDEIVAEKTVPKVIVADEIEVAGTVRAWSQHLLPNEPAVTSEPRASDGRPLPAGTR